MDLIPGSGRSPGEGKATHYSIPAWRIPRTKEPGGLQSTGSQRVGPNSTTTSPLSSKVFLCFMNANYKFLFELCFLFYEIILLIYNELLLGLRSWLNGKNLTCQCRLITWQQVDMHLITGSIPGSERSPGEGNGNPLQYPCLGNLMERGTWWATV